MGGGAGLYRTFSYGMALFWVFVQQICLVCARWACDDLSGEKKHLTPFMAAQAVLFIVAAALAAGDLTDWLPRLHEHTNNSPSMVWQFICTVMLALDGGLIAYAWRFYRLHALKGNLPVDNALKLFVAWGTVCLLLYGIYFAPALSIAVRHSLSLWEWEYICLFYFRIVNTCYLILEGGMGLVVFLLWRNLRKEGFLDAHS